MPCFFFTDKARTLHIIGLSLRLATGWGFAQQPAPCDGFPVEDTDPVLCEQQKKLWIEQHPVEYQEMLKEQQLKISSFAGGWTSPVTREQFLQMSEPEQRGLVPTMFIDLLQPAPPKGTDGLFILSEDQFMGLPLEKQIHVLKNPMAYFVVSDENMPSGQDLTGNFTKATFFALSPEQVQVVDVSQTVELDRPIPATLPDGARIISFEEFRAASLEQRLTFLKHPELHFITE